jgi:hypothetical protein
MKLRLTTLLTAIVLAGSLAAVAHVYGEYSTPGICLQIANLPGSFVALVLSWTIGEKLAFYAVCAFVNWGVYFYLAKKAVFWKRVSG